MNGISASSVSGIIDRSPSTVANSAPSRIPSHAGIDTSRIPTTEITIVQYAIGVWIGVNPACDRLNFSVM